MRLKVRHTIIRKMLGILTTRVKDDNWFINLHLSVKGEYTNINIGNSSIVLLFFLKRCDHCHHLSVIYFLDKIEQLLSKI